MTKAARATDTTDHGGTITVGSTTVQIEQMPAARLGDSFVCPQVTVIVPHVGGVIASGSSSVLIEGRPAARVGDTGSSEGPPCTIAKGASTVSIGD